MKMEIIRACRIAGEHCAPGDVVDVPDSDVRFLEHRGFAKPHKGAKPARTVEKRTKVRIVRACLIGGKHAAEGSTVMVAERDARFLIHRGHAKAIADGKATAKDGE